MQIPGERDLLLKPRHQFSAFVLAVLNPHVTHTAIDGALFPDEMVRRDIQAVPVVYLNGRRFADGRMDLEQILTRLAREDTSSDED
ncbi:MAG: hypothetical protein B7Z26_00130 [Asticcacaulis sp. 32-58-5]|nr:MAG: hypothetical protein B7Z26_00130 [Asticcacaulis sp. 32-58-5]